MKHKKQEDDPVLSNGMRLSEFQRLTAPRFSSKPPGYSRAKPEQLDVPDPDSKTQRRKKSGKKLKLGHGVYGTAKKHSARGLAGSARRKAKDSWSQVFKTTGQPKPVTGGGKKS